jgi:hypothetical protein
LLNDLRNGSTDHVSGDGKVEPFLKGSSDVKSFLNLESSVEETVEDVVSEDELEVLASSISV